VLVGDPVDQLSVMPPVHLGEAPRQVLEQQLEDFPLTGRAFGQRGEDLVALCGEQTAALFELRGEAIVDLDPVFEIERLQPHRQAPRPVEERSMAGPNDTSRIGSTHGIEITSI
jgi:hypothetical protein